MKTYLTKLSLFALIAIFASSCEPKHDKKEHHESKTSDFAYELSIIEEKSLDQAPSLQSFAHGIDGDNWLLFAGRTNSTDSLNGGLHKIGGNSNYSNTSFTPPSYNDHIFVYNVVTNTSEKISLEELKTILKENFESNHEALKGFESVFKNSNSLVKQNGEYLYLIGGYGPISFEKPKNGYITYNHLARIHVPSLINLVKKDYSKVKADKLFSFARNSSLISTGGELHIMGPESSPVFYMAGGHNFGNGQKYVDAVYPFTLTDSTDHILKISMETAISDVLDPTLPAADNLSTFRRRDGPITPSLFKSPVKDQIEQGLTFYTGVFKPGSDSNLQAWNDAIYVHPSFANESGKLFTLDAEYNQNNFNVYSCPSFVIYDSKTDINHTFLLGGIGDGSFADTGNLSGFTNTAVHIETDISKRPFRSSHELIQPNRLFNQSEENKPPFYGAEAILFVNEDLPLFSLADEKSTTVTEILDLTSFEDTDIQIGYIFGGIEAFQSNPGTYGKTYSRASNKIWKVVLKKK